MTLFNIVSVLVFIIIVVVAVRVYLRNRQRVREAEGLGSVNERGEVGTSHEGDIVGESKT